MNTPHEHFSEDDTPKLPARVEQELRAMTTWTGDHPALWERAIDRVAYAAPSVGRHRRFWAVVRQPPAIAAIIMLSFVGLLFVGVLIPSLGKARAPVPLERRARNFDSAYLDSFRPAPPPASPAVIAGLPAMDRKNLDASERVDESDAFTRQVIHKATLELSTPDVAAAFVKVQHLLRADLSEFVESSSLTGEGKDAQGQVVLRIASSRRDEAFNQIRQIAKVSAESITGDDVTAHAVDLDARLRNERQVETELLELLTARRGAPLTEVLALRDKLSNVRESIERLQGQRDHLARQVSMATVLVIIRADSKPEPNEEPKPGLIDHFLTVVDQSWNDGARTLADSLAWIVRVFIGGLFCWLMLAIGIAAALRLWRRARFAV